jgi:ankyrin repeat protein
MKTNFKILFLFSIFSITEVSVFSMDSCVLTEDDLLSRDPYIIIANRDVNWCDKNGQTALHYAAIEDHADFIIQLLERDADPQICDSKGMIPLFHAIIGEHYDCIDILTPDENYANITGPNRTTALHLAALRGYTQGVKILIEKGAVVNARDDNGKTPLYYAEFGKQRADTGKHSECIKILRANGAKI